MSSSFNRLKRSAERPRSSYNDIPVVGRRSRSGVVIQCQFCPGQAFRRSTLRSEDFRELFLMRYPVRCLRCSQRQLVSFAIASISLPSNVKHPRHARTEQSGTKSWKEPTQARSPETTDE
jgi:hypothetical protein